MAKRPKRIVYRIASLFTKVSNRKRRSTVSCISTISSINSPSIASAPPFISSFYDAYDSDVSSSHSIRRSSLPVKQDLITAPILPGVHKLVAISSIASNSGSEDSRLRTMSIESSEDQKQVKSPPSFPVCLPRETYELAFEVDPVVHINVTPPDPDPMQPPSSPNPSISSFSGLSLSPARKKAHSTKKLQQHSAHVHLTRDIYIKDHPTSCLPSGVPMKQKLNRPFTPMNKGDFRNLHKTEEMPKILSASCSSLRIQIETQDEEEEEFMITPLPNIKSFTPGGGAVGVTALKGTGQLKRPVQTKRGTI